MALHGMSVDNSISAQIVTADEQHLMINEKQNADLFWALRGGGGGGGGNFGVVPSLTFKLHPVSDVMGGIVAHPLPAANGMLRFYRETTSRISDELTVFAGLLHAPDGSGHKIGAMIGFHADQTKGAKALASIRAFGPPIMDMMGSAIDTLVQAFGECFAPMGSILIEHFHGAVTRVPVKSEHRACVS